MRWTRWDGVRTALLSASLVGALAGTLPAQSPRVEIVLPSKDALATQVPSVRTGGIITASHTAELIQNGFPARLHYKLQRWAAGTFVNDVKATQEWEVIVEYEALGRDYRVVRATDDQAVLLGTFPTLQDAAAKVAEPYPVQISLPKRGQKTYYSVTVQVEAMSLGDLDEVRRWLNGELKPAVRGKKSAGTAITTGVRTLLVRLLGGEHLQYKVSTRVFRP